MNCSTPSMLTDTTEYGSSKPYSASCSSVGLTAAIWLAYSAYSPSVTCEADASVMVCTVGVVSVYCFSVEETTASSSLFSVSSSLSTVSISSVIVWGRTVPDSSITALS